MSRGPLVTDHAYQTASRWLAEDVFAMPIHVSINSDIDNPELDVPNDAMLVQLKLTCKGCCQDPTFAIFEPTTDAVEPPVFGAAPT
jgi:hypothetical protein